MGGQNSYIQDLHRPIDINLAKPIKSEPLEETPYNLASQAQKTYNRLLSLCNNNQFLNLPPTDSQTQVKFKNGFYKLKTYDAYYHGEWKYEQPWGRGIIRFPDGSTLVGIFKNNYCHGSECYAIFKDGSYYKGNISQNILTGQGTLINKTVEYNGNWQNNLPHGQGVQNFANGDRYIGTFQNGLKHGPSSLFIWKQHPIYKQYKGSFANGKISGEGILTLKKHNTVIQGQFSEKEVHNVVLNCQRCKLTANFKQGKIQGKGKIQIKEIMQSFEGNFKQGQLNGKCIVLDYKKRQHQLYFFKGKQLQKVEGLGDKQIEKIITVIQKCYDGAQKHSDALIELKNQLAGLYECKFIEPFEHVFSDSKYLIVNIFQKVLMVASTQNN